MKLGRVLSYYCFEDGRRGRHLHGGSGKSSSKKRRNKTSYYSTRRKEGDEGGHWITGQQREAPLPTASGGPAYLLPSSSPAPPAPLPLPPLAAKRYTASDEMERCRCPHHQPSPDHEDEFDEMEEGDCWQGAGEANAPPDFTVSLFIEFERTEAAVEAVRLFQRQFEEQQQQYMWQWQQQQQQQLEVQTGSGQTTGTAAPPPQECLPPPTSSFPRVQLFRNAVYYDGVAEEEERLRHTAAQGRQEKERLWQMGSDGSPRGNDDSDDEEEEEEDDDLDDLFGITAMSLLAEAVEEAF